MGKRSSVSTIAVFLSVVANWSFIVSCLSLWVLPRPSSFLQDLTVFQPITHDTTFVFCVSSLFTYFPVENSKQHNRDKLKTHQQTDFQMSNWKTKKLQFMDLSTLHSQPRDVAGQLTHSWPSHWLRLEAQTEELLSFGGNTRKW